MMRGLRHIAVAANPICCNAVRRLIGVVIVDRTVTKRGGEFSFPFAFFGGEFQDSAACEPVSSSEALDELLHRTPGYNGWQQEQWLSHCGDFCAYLGSVGYEDISEFAEDLAADVPLEMMERLSKERSPTGYLFRCLTCGKSRLAWDSD